MRCEGTFSLFFLQFCFMALCDVMLVLSSLTNDKANRKINFRTSMWWDRSFPPRIIIIQKIFIVNIIVNAGMNIIIVVIVFRRTRLVAWLVREIFGFSLALEGEVDNRISIFFWKVWHWPRDIKFCQGWVRSKKLFEFSFSNTPLYFLSLSSHLRWYSLSRQNPGGRMSAPQTINTALMAPLVQCPRENMTYHPRKSVVVNDIQSSI